MRIDDLLLVGAGGHAKVVLEAVFGLWPHCSVSVFDEDPERTGKLVSGIEIAMFRDSTAGSSSIHVSIGNNDSRRRIIDSLRSSPCKLVSIISPLAIVSDSAVLSDAVFVAPGAIIAADARIGTSTIVNHNAVVDHDSVVGDYCHIAPGATLSGGCSIGEGTMIGAGANILPGIKIGANVHVGAGAVVTRSVSNGKTVTGVPAREIVS